MVCEVVITDHQIGWMKEFLEGLCQTDGDRVSVAEILATFRQLYEVLAMAKPMISRPPAAYAPHSRKYKLQQAIIPFMKLPLKAPR